MRCMLFTIINLNTSLFITEGRFFCYRAVITKEPSPCMLRYRYFLKKQKNLIIFSRKFGIFKNSSYICSRNPPLYDKYLG